MPHHAVIHSIAARLNKKANAEVRFALTSRSQFGLDVDCEIFEIVLVLGLESQFRKNPALQRIE